MIRLSLLLSVSISVDMQAQERIETGRLETRVYFRRGESEIDMSFRENSERLRDFSERFESLLSDSTFTIRKVRIVGGASPDGMSTSNTSLSDRRVSSITSFLGGLFPMDGVSCDVLSKGIDWERLAELATASSVPYKEEVLEILEHTPVWIKDSDSVIVDGRKRQLGMLHDGVSWFYLEEHVFPDLRCAQVDVIYESKANRDTVIRYQVFDTVVRTVTDTIRNIITDTVTYTVNDTIRCYVPDTVLYIPSTFMSLRTNLLYDAALVPNVGVEFHLGRGWSVGANGVFAWWDSDPKHLYWRIYGGELTARKYFGRSAHLTPLTGHHAGVYAQVLSYDFELGGRGYMSDLSYGGGIEYGYALQVREHIAIDFSFGVGYLGGEYKEYLPMDGHYVWQSTKQRHWFGPTKAEITFVWIIDRYVKTGKGGVK